MGGRFSRGGKVGILQRGGVKSDALQGKTGDGRVDIAVDEAYFKRSFKKDWRLKAVGGDGQVVGGGAEQEGGGVGNEMGGVWQEPENGAA